jgi:hypothetical protein
MKKIYILIFALLLANPILAKRSKRENLEIDYSSLSSDTVLTLVPSKEYNLKISNLPENITSTKLKKSFKGSFLNISSSREKVSKDFNSFHRLRTKKSYDGLLSVTLELYEKNKHGSEDDSDDSDDDSRSRKSSGSDSLNGYEDNILVESINFNIQVLPLLF